MVPVERIELPTFGLQNRCSTAELNRLKRYLYPLMLIRIADDPVSRPVYGSWQHYVNASGGLFPRPRAWRRRARFGANFSFQK
jgi:hypothetical protein